MEYLNKYGFNLTEATISASLESVVLTYGQNLSPEILKSCFAAMDLTTLSSSDTPSSVKSLVDKANRIPKEFPSCPMPASVCVYPNFAEVVYSQRKSPELHVTTVSAAFPSAQSFLPVKVLETELAIQNGADEIDIVLPLNSFFEGNYLTVVKEITAIREAIDKKAASLGRAVVLKVILETGLLDSLENIATAAFLSMDSGADFIKTSTGKVEINATPRAAYIMCECIRLFYLKTGRKVGFKPAGGIASSEDATIYYGIVESLLGKEWTSKQLFRLGVSRLGNNLLSSLEQKEIKYF